MFFSDKGTRDLLPLIELHLDEIPGATPVFDGDPAPAANVPHHAVPQAMQPAGDLPSVEEQRDDDSETFSNEEQAPPAIHIQEMPGGNGSTVHEISIPIDQGFLSGNPVSFTYKGATGELEHNGGVQPVSLNRPGMQLNPVLKARSLGPTALLRKFQRHLRMGTPSTSRSSQWSSRTPASSSVATLARLLLASISIKAS